MLEEFAQVTCDIFAATKRGSAVFNGVGNFGVWVDEAAGSATEFRDSAFALGSMPG